MIKASVIICAHNPRGTSLHRTLEALDRRSLSKEEWELLLIDNASKEPLASRFDLSWHPNAQHMVENELGLFPARLCGMREARSDLLIFVDDDNVLEPNYLDEAAKCFNKRTMLKSEMIINCAHSAQESALRETLRALRPPPEAVQGAGRNRQYIDSLATIDE